MGGSISHFEVIDLHDINKRMLCVDNVLAMFTDVLSSLRGKNGMMKEERKNDLHH